MFSLVFRCFPGLISAALLGQNPFDFARAAGIKPGTAYHLLQKYFDEGKATVTKRVCCVLFDDDFQGGQFHKLWDAEMHQALVMFVDELPSRSLRALLHTFR